MPANSAATPNLEQPEHLMPLGPVPFLLITCCKQSLRVYSGGESSDGDRVYYGVCPTCEREWHVVETNAVETT